MIVAVRSLSLNIKILKTFIACQNHQGVIGIYGDGAAFLPHRIENFGRLAVVAVIFENFVYGRFSITVL